MRQISYLKAIAEALREEMKKDPGVMIMGEDVELGVYGVTAGFKEEFGGDRVRDTPLSEAGFVGAGIGAAMVGARPVVDFTVSSFMYCAMDQLVSMASKTTYLYGGQAKIPVVFRAALQGGNSGAAQHSDRPHPMFMNVPGLKIIVPSTPEDAKGLLKTAILDDDPVICFEDVYYWLSKGEVPEGEYYIPFGKGKIRKKGKDVTIVGIGRCVDFALRAAQDLEAEGISVEVIDPRTLVPLDKEIILESVKKTGRLVVADMAHLTCSAASEISAIVSEVGFWYLKSPIRRVATLNTYPHFNPKIEPLIYPSPEKIADAARLAMKGRL